jgi:uncharacterized membrane protein
VITFTQPIYLALLALIPLSIWIALPRLFKRRQTNDDRQTINDKRSVFRRSSSVLRHPSSVARRISKRMIASLLVRAALLASVIFALAGMQAVRFSDKLAVAFLIDASDSVGAAGRDEATTFVRDALRNMRSDARDQAAVVVFGADAQIERSLSFAKDLAALGAQVRSTGTNVEGAIRLGLSLLPNDTAKRIVLLSDGKQTVGDAEAAARLAQATNARLDAFPLPTLQGPDATIERIDSPQRASVGQQIPLQIVIRSNTAMRGQLTVFAGPDIVAQENVNLVIGQNEFSVRANATRAGFTAFRAQVVADQDVRPQNNALSSSVIVGGPPRVLMVASLPTSQGGASDRVDETAALKQALAATGVTVDEVSPRAMPTEIQSLAAYQSVVLVNVPARDLSLRAMYSIQSYVRDIGGGLVVIGGPNSYGVGGYFRTPLEETLPVDMQVKDPRRFPSVSIVIVMDKSGSMNTQENGVLKMRLAAEAAARVAELVNDDDEVTVIGFDTEPVDVIGPFQGRERAKYIPQILSIAPGGGGIYVFESLEEAQRIIGKSNKLTKFVILLSDGSDSERQDGARDLVRRMNTQDNVTLTVVAIGDGSDVPFLKGIASVGKGRFHLTDKAANLPTIFTEEAALAQKSYIVEQAFFPKQGATSPILSGITQAPQLLGYIASSPKPAAQVILKANDTDPLLATWQYGLGRAVAFTSDATGRWGKQWVQWEGFPKFWAQTIRWTILDRGQSSINASVLQRGEQTVVVAEVPETQTDGTTTLRATVLDADGRSRELNLAQVAPGRFEAETYLDQAGAYYVRVSPVAPTTPESSQSSQSANQLNIATVSYVKPYSPEYAQTAGGEDTLRDWVAAGGGNLLSSPREVFQMNAPVAASRTDLFPFLLALAALLLPFDIGVRRITVSLRKLFDRAATLVPQVSGSPAMQPAHVGSLFQTKPHTTSTSSASNQPAVVIIKKSESDAQPSQTAARAMNPSSIESSSPAQPQKSAPMILPKAPQNAGAAASELLKRKKQRREGQGDLPNE